MQRATTKDPDSSTSPRPAKQPRRSNTPPSSDPPSNESTPRLEPKFWALILTDYLSYQDVMHFSVVCRSFLHRVLPLMTRLCLEHAQELHVVQARRFPNVEQVRIYSYVKQVPYSNNHDHDDVADELHHLHQHQQQQYDDDEDDSHDHHQELCPITAGRVIPFCMAFPKLKYVFVGGKSNGAEQPVLPPPDSAATATSALHESHDTYRSALADGHGGDDDDRSDGVVSTREEEIHYGLVRSFCGAFQSGALPRDLQVQGVIGYHHGGRHCHGLCRLVCDSFPLSHVARLTHGSTTATSAEKIQTCLSSPARLAILSRRPGGTAFLQNPARLRPLLARYEVGHLPHNFASYDPATLEEMEVLCNKYRCNPALLSADDLRRHLPEQPLLLSSFQTLRDIGFQLPREFWPPMMMDERDN